MFIRNCGEGAENFFDKEIIGDRGEGAKKILAPPLGPKKKFWPPLLDPVKNFGPPLRPPQKILAPPQTVAPLPMKNDSSLKCVRISYMMIFQS